MAKVQFEVASPVEPEGVVEALTDFSPRRPELWPAIDPKVYHVHELSESFALVTEGTDVMGGVWATELYEWAIRERFERPSRNRTSGIPGVRGS
jgi:hypothetical protein